MDESLGGVVLYPSPEGFEFHSVERVDLAKRRCEGLFKRHGVITGAVRGQSPYDNFVEEGQEVVVLGKNDSLQIKIAIHDVSPRQRPVYLMGGKREDL